MRWQVTLAVCLLLLTAGCSSLSRFDSTRPAPVTPAPVPSDDGREPLPPPGFDRDGLHSATALATAHREALSNSSYTFHERYVGVTESGGNRSVLRRTETTTVEGVRTYRHELSRDRTHADERVERYSQSTYADGRHWFERRDDGTVTYHTGTLRFGRDQYAYEAAFYIDQYVVANRSWTRPVERNGVQYFHVVLTGGDPAWAALVDSSATYRVDLLVRADGLVRRLDVRYETVAQRVRYRFWYTDLGATTVSEPAWLDAVNDTEPRAAANSSRLGGDGLPP